MGIRLSSATEAVDDSPSGRFHANVLTAVGQFDNEVRAERTLNGMKNRVQEGRWQWPAPTGYMNGNKSGPSLVPDPHIAPLLRRLFDLVALGTHTKASALAEVTAHGLRSPKGVPLTQETIRKILINPVYTGRIHLPKWGVSTKGDFEPLVSEETFDRVQAILDGRAPAYRAHRKERTDFPLRGLVLCKDCRKPVTASKRKGKGGNKFGYYRCHRATGHMNVRAELVEDAFIALLNRMIPEERRMKLIERIFRNQIQRNIDSATSDVARLQSELKREEGRKSLVLNQFADGVLSPGDFTILNTQITRRITEVRERLATAEMAEHLNADELIEFLHHKLWNTSIEWQMADLRGKQSIQRRVFPEGVKWEKSGFGTPVTHSLYSLLANDSMSESEMVAPQGFEPRLIESESTVLPLNEGATGESARTRDRMTTACPPSLFRV